MREEKILHIVNLVDLINRKKQELYYLFVLNFERCVANVCNFIKQEKMP